ncbi:hypothetical protein BDW62DRAFT_66771 [Aspergillus aurantiobrunneus]
MGQKLSVVKGVKSENFTQPGNAVNEIWVGDTEIISRLPFGDNDMEQASWPKKGMPKIPWHNFIIPMKRGLETSSQDGGLFNLRCNSQVPSDWMACCKQNGCTSNPNITNNIITGRLVGASPSPLLVAILWTFVIWLFVRLPKKLKQHNVAYDPTKTYGKKDVQLAARRAILVSVIFAISSMLACLGDLAWGRAYQFYEFKSWDWLLLVLVMRFFMLYKAVAIEWEMGKFWLAWWKMRRSARNRQDEEVLVEDAEDQPNCPEKQRRASV